LESSPPMVALKPPSRKNNTKVRKKRRIADMENSVLWYVDDAGVPRRRDPRNTDWYREYVSEPSVSATNFETKFRARFRLPYAAFLSLARESQRVGWFSKYNSRRPRGLERPHPLELYLLGAMRYIGRGWVLDDLEEATKISLSSHQRFLSDFLTVGSTVWYSKWVRYPTTPAEVDAHSHEYAMAGYPGVLVRVHVLRATCYVLHAHVIAHYNHLILLFFFHRVWRVERWGTRGSFGCARMAERSSFR
jgi:hypothetical protein